MSDGKVYGGGWGWVHVERSYGEAPRPMSDLRAMAWWAVILSSLGSAVTYAAILVVS